MSLSPGGRLGEGGSYEPGWTNSAGLSGETQESGAWRRWTHHFWYTSITLALHLNIKQFEQG